MKDVENRMGLQPFEHVSSSVDGERRRRGLEVGPGGREGGGREGGRERGREGGSIR